MKRSLIAVAALMLAACNEVTTYTVKDTFGTHTIQAERVFSSDGCTYFRHSGEYVYMSCGNVSVTRAVEHE